MKTPTSHSLQVARERVGRRAFMVGAAGIAGGLAVERLLPGPVLGDEPSHGGRLNLGVPGAVALGAIDPQKTLGGDGARNVANSGPVWEALTTQNPDGAFGNVLLESLTPEDEQGKTWTLKIKEGVLFHNEKEVTSEDAIFSLKRLLEPGAFTAGQIGNVLSYETLDKRSFRMVLEKPRGWLQIGLGDPFSSIVPVDYDPKTPVGTGPFKIKDISLNNYVLLERFDKYHGNPAHLDEVAILGFADSAAQLNALQSGQIDAIQGVDASLVGEFENNPSIKLYNSPTGQFLPIGMRTDVPPFNDVRLRQALRLVLDRESVISSSYNGYATRGEDLYGRYDVDYDKARTRQRDVTEARKLVEDAGAIGLEIDLVMYSDVGTALVLAQNAKEIGITINVKQLDGPSYFNDELMERKFFGGDTWPTAPILLSSALMDGPDAGYNQLRFNDEEFLSLRDQANSTTDPSRLHDLLGKLQAILFERGGWIIPAFPNTLALYHDKIAGVPEYDYSQKGLYAALGKLSLKQ